MGDIEAADVENPHPSIHDLFQYYNEKYFEDKLGACSLSWSGKRMTLCAGVCQYSTFGGCEIRLSEPLLKYRPVSDLKNTLLHEMIHAYLFLTNGNRDHDDHGPRFQHLMRMINDCQLGDEERPKGGYAITVYHKFKDEVDLYRVHQWRCIDCADLIKRAMNRKPSFSDCPSRSEACSMTSCHWHMHKKLCGGNYEKIHEPAGYVDRRKKSGKQAGSDTGKQNDSSADESGQTLGKSGQKRKNSGEGVLSKKGAKGPPSGDKASSLKSYFPKVQEDTEWIAYRQVAGAEKDSSCDEQIECRNVSLGEERHFSVGNVSAHEQSGVDKVAKEGNGLKEAMPPGASLQGRSGKEALGTHPYSCSRRKKGKTTDEFRQNQDCKEPLVILAWANWVSYESDEEREEPLMNKRTERRKKERLLELFKKGKAALDHNEGLQLVAVKGSPIKPGLPVGCQCEHQLENKVQDEEEISGTVVVPRCLGVVVDLSDDENIADGTKATPGLVKEQTQGNNCLVERRDFSDLRDLEADDSPANQGSIGRKRRETFNGAGGEASLLVGKRSRSRRGNAAHAEIMTCPICHLVFPGDEPNQSINEHIDDCLQNMKS